MNPSPVYVSLEFTPNPNTLKYSVNRELLSRGAMNFLKLADAEAKSPLAAGLLKIQGIAAVMIGNSFVTITKSDDGDWDLVHKGASSLIESHLTEGKDVFLPGALDSSGVVAGGSEIEIKIKDILDREIRPAVAMDGGDISFDHFEAGIVYLQMQGSCAGCPSSTATLKMGIETRLKQAIPEILEVVAV